MISIMIVGAMLDRSVCVEWPGVCWYSNYWEWSDLIRRLTVKHTNTIESEI